jgi:hypothetical protein
MTQVVECLPSKHKALSLNPSTTKKGFAQIFFSVLSVFMLLLCISQKI